jgi:hypothetical protein
MSPLAASTQSEFLSRLAVPVGQYLELRLITPDVRGASQHYCSSIDEAIERVAATDGTANVYVGACPRDRRSGSRGAVTAVAGAWADLDFHQLDPTSRDVALELAYRRIEALGIPPTMLVHTGNGLQAWWLFHEPVKVTDQWSAERFEAINSGLAERLGGDHVHDLARVLRVPGTMNLPDAKKRARGCLPVLARLLDSDGPSYELMDLGSFAVPVSEVSTRSGTSCAMSAQPPEDDAAIVGAFEQLLSQLGPHHPLSRTWTGRRQLPDGSRSAFDMALACQMVRLRIRREFAASVLRSNPCGKGHDATDQYIDRTVARAFAKCGPTHGR